MFMKRRYALQFSLILLLVAGSCHAATEIFQISNRPADEILPAVLGALSPQGKAVADRVGNMIIVNDTPETLETVRTLLLFSDQRLPQVTVHMAFDAVVNDRYSPVETGGKKRGRHLSTEAPHFRRGDTRQQRSSHSFLTVSSGSSGYIRMGREVPVTEQWILLCRRHKKPLLLQGIRTIETGMEVLPVAAGDQVILTIIPRISWMEKGRPETFRFVDAATRVTLPRSQWFALGGMSSVTTKNNDILGTIISTGESDRGEGFALRIKTDVKE